MDWIQSLVLGLIEGLTEYLPVSSTGHLLVARSVLGIEAGEAFNAYAICIQAGAILAVVGLFRHRLAQMLRGLAGRDPAGLALLVRLVLAFVPAAVVGLLAERRIKEVLFNDTAIAVAWLFWGAVLLLLSFLKRDRPAGGGRPLEALDVRRALVIGLAQCLAMWPGTSRSLITILAGLAVGLTLPAAVEFSFLLGVVTLSAATAKDAWSDGALMVQAYGVVPLAVGFVAATVSAVAAVRWMVGFLNRHGLAVFGYYRIAIGVALLAVTLAACTGGGDTPAVDAVADPAAEAADPGDDPGTWMACVVGSPDAASGCAHFENRDGLGVDSMRAARAACNGGAGTWVDGDCPAAGLVGQCLQPGTEHFVQLDACYAPASQCKAVCLGTWTDAAGTP